MRRLDPDGPARLLARPEVRAVLAGLDAPGEETRLVGGCVRDALLGVAAADIDLATTLLPNAVIDRARAAGLKAVPTGIEHGTVTLVVAGRPVEVTTLREDVETDGRHAVVRFGRDFARDAERRDFTVNALSLGADGTLHDTTGGRADLAEARIRFIGDPATRIREDALRILRFFRFHARFGGGAPDAPALAACVAARAALASLSRERVRMEFLKLLAAPGAPGAVAILDETGLLARITGGVAERGRLTRAIEAGADTIQRLAALSVTTRADAERLAEGLRLSKAEHATLDAYARALAALRTPRRDRPAGAPCARGRARACSPSSGDGRDRRRAAPGDQPGRCKRLVRPEGRTRSRPTGDRGGPRRPWHSGRAADRDRARSFAPTLARIGLSHRAGRGRGSDRPRAGSRRGGTRHEKARRTAPVTAVRAGFGRLDDWGESLRA